MAVAQPARGFRYAADAFWLAGFALEEPATDALELGAGSGVVSLLLAARGLRVRGVELRTEWALLWSSSLAASRPDLEVELVRGDVRDVPAGTWDLVVTNPPYAPAGSGPVSPNPMKAAARTESTATLDAFLRAGLRAGRRLCAVLPSSRLSEARAFREPGCVVRVGRRRVLVQWGGARREDVALSETSERVLGWYRAVGAHPPAPR